MKIISENTTKILILSGIVLIFLSVLMFMKGQALFYDAPINSERVGQFGDFVGGVAGSIWALAGVILFYVALAEQRRDFKTNKEALSTQIQALEKQTDEFSLQKEELRLTRQIFKEQSKTMFLQQFESTFFNLISLLQEVIIGIEIPHKAVSHKGRQAFQIVNEKVEMFMSNNIKNQGAIHDFNNALNYVLNNEPFESESYNENYGLVKKRMVASFRVVVLNSLKNSLSHYFRMISSILDTVSHEKKLDVEQKQFYMKIFLSQMSNDELRIIYYLALCEQYSFHSFFIDYDIIGVYDDKAFRYPKVEKLFLMHE